MYLLENIYDDPLETYTYDKNWNYSEYECHGKSSLRVNVFEVILQ